MGLFSRTLNLRVISRIRLLPVRCTYFHKYIYLWIRRTSYHTKYPARYLYRRRPAWHPSRCSYRCAHRGRAYRSVERLDGSCHPRPNRPRTLHRSSTLNTRGSRSSMELGNAFHRSVGLSHLILFFRCDSCIPGMALSRIGLWMFDLAQLQILQESLESHPRRNALTGLQYSRSFLCFSFSRGN
jgi:hypothetical protein